MVVELFVKIELIKKNGNGMMLVSLALCKQL
jgi:hypothetical protein